MPPEYLDTMLGYTQLAYCGAILVSLATVAWAYTWLGQEDQERSEEPEVDSKATGSSQEEVIEEVEEVTSTSDVFEISPLDECEFVPLLSQEEDKRVAEEIAPKTRYIALNEENPAAHINAYLDMVHDDDEEVTSNTTNESDDSKVIERANNYTTDDISKYINPKDLNVLDDPRESPSRRGSVMSRVKKGRQRAIRNAVERDMTADDRLREQMAANQMLSRVYTVMRENKEVFGDTSFDDVKSQMDMYKA